MTNVNAGTQTIKARIARIREAVANWHNPICREWDAVVELKCDCKSGCGYRTEIIREQWIGTSLEYAKKKTALLLSKYLKDYEYFKEFSGRWESNTDATEISKFNEYLIFTPGWVRGCKTAYITIYSRPI